MKDETNREREETEPKKYGNEKPISLHPLKPEEALRRAMSVPPPSKRERQADKKAGKKD